MKTYKITAINIAENIDFVNFKVPPGGTLITYTNFELFFQMSDNQFIAVFQNGVVVFSNYSPPEISTMLFSLKDYMINPMNNTSETIEVLLTETKKVYTENNILYVPLEYDGQNLIRIIMNDLVQILAIDFYIKITEKLLAEVKTYADNLEKSGKIGLLKKNRNRFIGRCLTTKNKIADNLYIFDTPSLVWGDQNLENVHNTVTASYNLKARLKELEYTLSVINENLQIFMEIFEHTRASMLEIVVIILIVFEIVNSLTERFHIF
jgi:required for meiotic nuclear division protein 1